jgi:hypothetical protein
MWLSSSGNFSAIRRHPEPLYYNTFRGAGKSRRRPVTWTGMIVGPIATISALVAGVMFWNFLDKSAEGWPWLWLVIIEWEGGRSRVQYPDGFKNRNSNDV